MTTEFQRTARSAGIIGITAFGGALVGFVLQLLVAYYFGASSNTDAYFMALSTSELLSKLLLGGSITAVFIPMFVERISRGRTSEAWELSLNIFHLTAIAFAAILVLLAIFTRPFVGFIAPGFNAATTELTVQLLRVLLPSFLFLYLVELATSQLHALKQFAIPAWTRVISPAVSIVIIVAFVQTLGITALALGTLIGAVAQFTYLVWGLRRHGLQYRFILRAGDPAIRRLLYLVYPFIFSILVTQGAGIVYRILVSDLTEGSLASLKFAEKIMQLATIIFLNSITFVIYPLLSEKASNQNYEGMRTTIASALRLVSLISVPVIIGVVVLREPLVRFVFQRGSFSEQDVALTSVALSFLIINLLTSGFSSILGHAVLALQQTRAAVAVTIASHAVATSLFVLLVPPLAHAGLALASSLAPLSAALLYFLYLRRTIPPLTNVFIHPTYVKIAALAGALFLVMYLLVPTIAQLPVPHGLSLLLQLLVPATVGSVIFFGGAFVLRISEMRELVQILRQRFRKA